MSETTFTLRGGGTVTRTLVMWAEAERRVPVRRQVAQTAWGTAWVGELPHDQTALILAERGRGTETVVFTFDDTEACRRVLAEIVQAFGSNSGERGTFGGNGGGTPVPTASTRPLRPFCIGIRRNYQK